MLSLVGGSVIIINQVQFQENQVVCYDIFALKLAYIESRNFAGIRKL